MGAASRLGRCASLCRAGPRLCPDWYTIPCLGWDLVVAGIVAYYIVASRWAAETPSFASPRAVR